MGEQFETWGYTDQLEVPLEGNGETVDMLNEDSQLCTTFMSIYIYFDS